MACFQHFVFKVFLLLWYSRNEILNMDLQFLGWKYLSRRSGQVDLGMMIHFIQLSFFFLMWPHFLNIKMMGNYNDVMRWRFMWRHRLGQSRDGYRLVGTKLNSFINWPTPPGSVRKGCTWTASGFEKYPWNVVLVFV